MSLKRIVVCLAAALSLAACMAPTESSAPSAQKEIFYATPAAAASLAADQITIHEATDDVTPRDGLQPFVRGESGLVPASAEDLEKAKSPDLGILKCHVCDDFGNCQPICCPGTPHCQLWHA